MLAMRKRRKLHEHGTAASEAGEPEHPQHIPAHRPTTQQREGRGSHLQPSPSSSLVGGPARQQQPQQPHQQQWRSGMGAAAHHRLSPTPAGLAESPSNADLHTAAARGVHAPPAAAAAAGRGRHLLRQSQQLQPRAGGGTDSGAADRRASAMGDLQMSLGGTGLGLTPRGGGAGSSLGPWRQQGASQLPLPPPQQQGHAAPHAQHAGGLEPGEHLPPLDDKRKPQLRHAATINVRAGPLPGQLLPGQPRTAAAAPVEAVAAAAAAATAVGGSRLAGLQAQRRTALDDSDHRRRQPLGPEDSLSYGPPRHAVARQREREPAAAGGGSRPGPSLQAPAGSQARAAGPRPAAQQQHPPSPGAGGPPAPYLAALQRSPAGRQAGGSPGRGPLAAAAAASPPSTPAGLASPMSPASRAMGTQPGWKASPAPHRLAAAASPPHSPSGSGMAASPITRHLQGAAGRQQQQQQQGRAGWSPKAAGGAAASPTARQAGVLRQQPQLPAAGVLSPRRALNVKPGGAPAAVGAAGAASGGAAGAGRARQRGRGA